MADDQLTEVEEILGILISEELETHHRLEGHETGIEACPVCRSHVPRRSVA